MAMGFSGVVCPQRANDLSGIAQVFSKAADLPPRRQVSG